MLASWLAFGPSRARYAAVGQVRETSEKELILCNLLARRQAMLDLGGFNEALYPNEENALMDELQKRGGKLIYDPQLLVHRRPRSSLKSFARMLMTYGRGRAEQFRLHPTLGSALNFVPPLFCLYLLALPFLLALTPIGKLWLVPLAFYALAVLAQAVVLAAGGQVCAEPGGDPADCADACSLWPGLLARTVHDAEAAGTASAGRGRAGDGPPVTERILGMKNPVWTNAIKSCADPQRAKHFLDLLAATSAGAALQACFG